MISLIIPTTSKNKNYTDNLLRNINELYPDIEVIVEENDLVTLGENYNNAVARASGDKIILLHNDMVLSPGFVETMDKHIQPGRITTYTRIEPLIYNDTYPGKVILDCGRDLESFDQTTFNSYQPNFDLIDGGSQLFFGCMRNEYIGIDGITFKMFCEDDDLHRRYRLAGFDHKVSSAHVYHFVSKTSRAENTYQAIELASNRNYIRKWGSRNIAPKYNIAFVVRNCTLPVLEALEPWCDRIYIEDAMQVITSHYIEQEQPKTCFDLNRRVLHIEYNAPSDENDIIVAFDATRLTQQNFQYIQQLAAIIEESGDIGEFEIDIFKISIYSMETYEKNLVKRNEQHIYL
jgi:GT2 family glycosyltransferase